jgi:hypothetical protein
MMRAAVGVALFLTGSFTLAAQTSANHELQNLVQLSNGVPLYCPIGMYASQDIWNHTIAVQKGLGSEKFGQRISLTLRDFHGQHIVAGTVRVQGLTGKNHMLQTDNKTSQNSNSTRTLKVTFTQQADGSVSGDLWIGGFTSITSVQLLEATYSDGSIWRISAKSTCSVRPDPLMLVTNR